MAQRLGALKIPRDGYREFTTDCDLRLKRQGQQRKEKGAKNDLSNMTKGGRGKPEKINLYIILRSPQALVIHICELDVA